MSRYGQLWSAFWSSTRTNGWVRTLWSLSWQVTQSRKYHHAMAGDGFDAEHGTDTTTIQILSRFRTYETVQTGGIIALLELLQRDLGVDPSRFAFVDVGSGKGKVVMLAARLPFRRIVGVEFSPDLHRIAQKNLAIVDAKNRACSAIELLCADARELPFPDENSIFYMFNPFDALVLTEFIALLARSLAATPREVLIVYVNPRQGAVIEASGVFELVATPPIAALNGIRYAVYRTKSA